MNDMKIYSKCKLASDRYKNHYFHTRWDWIFDEVLYFTQSQLNIGTVRSTVGATAAMTVAGESQSEFIK